MYRINKSRPWTFGDIADPEVDRNCNRFYRKLTPAISARRVLKLDELFATSKTPVCFKRILLGTPNLSDDCEDGDHGRRWEFSLCNYGRMEQFWNFRGYTKQNLGVIDRPPTRHQVVIWDRKDGGRPLNGLGDIAAHIERTFKVAVLQLEWSDYSIRDQLLIAGNTTVLITGPGAGSFAAIYLPRGATVVRLYERYAPTLSVHRTSSFRLSPPPLTHTPTRPCPTLLPPSMQSSLSLPIFVLTVSSIPISRFVLRALFNPCTDDGVCATPSSPSSSPAQSSSVCHPLTQDHLHTARFPFAANSGWNTTSSTIWAISTQSTARRPTARLIRQTSTS